MPQAKSWKTSPSAVPRRGSNGGGDSGGRSVASHPSSSGSVLSRASSDLLEEIECHIDESLKQRGVDLEGHSHSRDSLPFGQPSHPPPAGPKRSGQRRRVRDGSVAKSKHSDGSGTGSTRSSSGDSAPAPNMQPALGASPPPPHVGASLGAEERSRASRARDGDRENDGEDDDGEDDDDLSENDGPLPPIRFFGNANSPHDDDSISQITSSVASHSYGNGAGGLLGYHFGGNGGGMWGGGGRGRAGGGSRTGGRNAGESFADSIDEIAFLLNPGPNVAGASRPLASSGSHGSSYASSAGSGRYSGAGSQGSRRGSSGSPGDRYGRKSRLRSAQNDGLPEQILRRLSTLFSYIISQTRMTVRHVEGKVLPAAFKLVRRKKQDAGSEDDEDEVDYFEMLMRPSDPSSSSRSQPLTKTQRFRLLLRQAFHLVVLFTATTAVLLGLRLAMRHGVQGANPAGGESGDRGSIRGGGGVLPPPALAGKVRRGGMAHHAPDGGVVRPGQDRRRIDSGLNMIDENGMDAPSQPQQPGAVFSIDHIGMDIPAAFENLADVNDLPVDGSDVPFFWHIPRTGGATMNDILGTCLYLTMASDAGGTDGHGMDKELQVLNFSRHLSYVNVDTSTSQGIQRAKDLNMISSNLADVVVSSLLHEASTMFTPFNRGRMFTLFRHPVERAVSLFHYVQDTQWRRSKNFEKKLSTVTIEEYFKGGMAENNWMTRFLTNELTKGELTTDDLNIAKEVLRRKCLVGLLKEKGESFARFERYFSWQLKTDSDKECHEKKLQWAWPLKHRHDDVEEGTDLWDLIVAQNKYDMELYEYAQLLFQEQRQFFQ